MSARSTIARCLVAVVVLAGMTSCTEPDREPPQPEGGAAATAAAPEPSQPAASLPTPVVIENLGKVPTWGGGSVAIASDRYQVMPGDTIGHSVKVLERPTNKLLFTHRVTRRGFEPVYAGIFRDRLVLIDSDVETQETFSPNGKKPPKVMIYHLTTGRSTPIADIPGAPAPSTYVEQASIDAMGRFLYPAQSKGGFANCIGEVDLSTMRGRTITCVRKPTAIFWAGSADTGVTWTAITTKNEKACRFSDWLDGDTVRHMTVTSECGSFDNGALDGWQLWSEQGLEEIQPAVPLTASDGSQKVDLGMMRPQSLMVCGSYAYWQFNEDGKPDRIVRWKPGAQVQTVYTAETEGASTYDDVIVFPQGCSDDHLALTATRLSTQVTKTTTVTLLYIDSR